jgi:hypothetical protein
MQPKSLDEVLGWFPAVDQFLFAWAVGANPGGETGDLLEIGAYLGKTAILMGRYLDLAVGERMIVCDLFGEVPGNEHNGLEMEDYRHYGDLPTREQFLANYRAFHEKDPEIFQMDSALLAQKLKASSCRFVHIDASHMYSQVRRDLYTAREVLSATGILVADDYRGRLSPGVGAAVWEAVVNGLKPLWLTEQKFYATWGDQTPLFDAFRAWAQAEQWLSLDIQEIAGYPVARVTDLSDGHRRAHEVAAKRWPFHQGFEDFACR